jgi:SAM-dependent methyltransferase
MSTELQDQIRERYAAAANAVTAGGTGCCGTVSRGTGSYATSVDAGCCGTTADAGCGTASGEPFGSGLYSAAERAELPSAAVAASLGCGNPLLVADLHAGETVLDLGSGGGIDVLLSARRVGPTGRAYGLDMTDEMLDLARRNAAEAGVSTVEFLKGTIEAIPLPAASVDVVISNCVINLSLDKPAVFAEVFRVLRPGGRIGVSDVVAEDEVTPDQRAERGEWVGCVAGALSRREYSEGLAAAGFSEVEVRFTHPVADGMHSAVVRAVKPAA